MNQGNWLDALAFLKSKELKGLKIGIDIGGCLVDSKNDPESIQEYPVASNAIEVLMYMREHGANMYIISYWREERAMDPFEWLHKCDIVPDLVAKEHVIFCKVDMFKAKARIMRALKLDIFFDDRQEILKAMLSDYPSRKINDGGRKCRASIGNPGEPWKKINDIPEFNDKNIDHYISKENLFMVVL